MSNINNSNNPMQINRERIDCAQMRTNITAFRMNNSMDGEIGVANYAANKETLSSGDKSDPDIKMVGRHKGSFADL